jgi:hypothetical protein
MSGVEFKITSKVQGIDESYTFTTGRDGKYNSADAGLWFGKKKDGTETEKIDGLGSLPVGTYVIEELRCDANKGYQLEPPITLEVTSATTYIVNRSARCQL